MYLSHRHAALSELGGAYAENDGTYVSGAMAGRLWLANLPGCLHLAVGQAYNYSLLLLVSFLLRRQYTCRACKFGQVGANGVVDYLLCTHIRQHFLFNPGEGENRMGGGFQKRGSQVRPPVFGWFALFEPRRPTVSMGMCL